MQLILSKVVRQAGPVLPGKAVVLQVAAQRGIDPLYFRRNTPAPGDLLEDFPTLLLRVVRQIVYALSVPGRCLGHIPGNTGVVRLPQQLLTGLVERLETPVLRRNLQNRGHNEPAVVRVVCRPLHHIADIGVLGHLEGVLQKGSPVGDRISAAPPVREELFPLLRLQAALGDRKAGVLLPERPVGGGDILAAAHRQRGFHPDDRELSPLQLL